jgi:hypothetical protein
MEIEGTVINAEIEDMNADGFPEVLIYTRNPEDHDKGTVIGFSVNNGKSISQIYFPPVEDNPDANAGYLGEDEFTIVETTLAHRFPVYENGTPTGTTRQIQYKLEDGEASRRFRVDKIVEY